MGRIVSSKSANSFLRSRRFVSDLKNDCVEEYCDKEEFFEAAENDYGEECVREGAGGMVYETYYKRCLSGKGNDSSRKVCMFSVKNQMSIQCNGGSSYRGQSQSNYYSEEQREEQEESSSIKFGKKKKCKGWNCKKSSHKNSMKKDVLKKVVSQGKKYYNKKKGNKKG